MKQIRIGQQTKDKSAAYKELGRFAVRLRAAATDAAPGQSIQVERFADWIGSDQWFDVQADAETYGSTAVRAEFYRGLEARAALAASLSTWEQLLMMPPPRPAGSTEVLAAFQRDRTALVDACDKLLSLLTRELKRGT